LHQFRHLLCWNPLALWVEALRWTGSYATANAGNKSAELRLFMQRRRTEEIKRCDSSQGDGLMNRMQSPFTVATHGHSVAPLFAANKAIPTNPGKEER
jgi:hypothetical protein